MRTRPLSASVAFSSALLLALAGCGSSDNSGTASPSGAAPSSGGASSSASGSTAAQGYPVTLKNCGRDLTIEKAPQRVVALNQSSAETLLSLGVGDLVVGTSTWFDDVLPQLKAVNDKIPRIADNNPSLEAVLAKEPDFLAATYHADLPGEGKTTMDQLAKLGVPTYMAPAECALAPGGKGDGRRDTPLTLDVILQEPLDLGRIMGVPEAGEKLVADLKARMAKASESKPGKGKTVAFWFANSESPYVAGGYGSIELAAKGVGLTNVFDSSHDEWPQVSWEAFAQKDPDVIVLGDLTRKRMTSETAAGKIAFLEKNPVTAQMKAVKNKSYIYLPGSDMNPSLRVVQATEKLAAGLKKLSAK